MLYMCLSIGLLPLLELRHGLFRLGEVALQEALGRWKGLRAPELLGPAPQGDLKALRA